VIPNMISIQHRVGAAALARTLGLIATGLVRSVARCPASFRRRFVPQHGWQILFLIGGIVPVVIAVCAYFWMPESIKVHEHPRGATREADAAARAPGAGYRVPEGARFVIEDERQSPGSNRKYLFGEGLAVDHAASLAAVRPDLMGYFFLLLWTPTLLTAAKLPPATAALTSASLQVGGHRWNATAHRLDQPPAVSRGVGPASHRGAVVGSIGLIGLGASKAVLLAASFAAGFCVLGVQSGINVCARSSIPRHFSRARLRAGSSASGRLGSIVGPLVGAGSSRCPSTGSTCGPPRLLVGAVICYTVHR